jgi:hypothetical protein
MTPIRMQETLWVGVPDRRPAGHVDWMWSVRRAGLAMAIAATLLWLLVVAAILFTPRSDGVPIGAGFLYIIAVPLSVAAALTLILTLLTTSRGTASSLGTRKTPVRLGAAALAAVSAVLLPVTFVLGSSDSMTRDVLSGLLFSGVGAFVTRPFSSRCQRRGHAEEPDRVGLGAYSLDACVPERPTQGQSAAPCTASREMAGTAASAAFSMAVTRRCAG